MSLDAKDVHGDDEIDLKELALSLWASRKLILLCTLTAIVLASVYLRVAEQKHTVTYTFQPEDSGDNRPNIGGLGGLASLAGVSLPSGDSSDFQTFQMLLQSEETATYLMQNEDLVRRIYKDEWNSDKNLFEPPQRSALGSIAGFVKRVLTGRSRPEYLPPNPARLAEHLSKAAFSHSEDRETGFLKLSSETPDPKLTIDIMTAAASAADNILRERFVERGQQAIEFYQRKIISARSREHREALAQLIVQEEQKLMLASSGGSFVAKPLTTPSVSLNPTSPKASLVLALAVVLGLFLGAAIALIKKALQND